MQRRKAVGHLSIQSSPAPAGCSPLRVPPCQTGGGKRCGDWQDWLRERLRWGWAWGRVAADLCVGASGCLEWLLLLNIAVCAVCAECLAHGRPLVFTR